MFPENEAYTHGIAGGYQNTGMRLEWDSDVLVLLICRVSSHFKLCQERHTLELGSTVLKHRLLREDQIHLAVLKGWSVYF